MSKFLLSGFKCGSSNSSSSSISQNLEMQTVMTHLRSRESHCGHTAQQIHFRSSLYLPFFLQHVILCINFCFYFNFVLASNSAYFILRPMFILCSLGTSFCVKGLTLTHLQIYPNEG
jgi:hypothetical protein